MSHKVRICFLIRRLDRGGAERQLVELLRTLDKERYEVSLVTLYDGGDLAPVVERLPGVRWFSAGKRGRWDLLAPFHRIISHLKAADPQILHGYLYLANIIAVLARPFLRNRPKIIFGVRSSHTHLEHYDWAAVLTGWLERRLALIADMYIANSEAGAAYSIGRGFRRERMAVVPNGVNIDEFRPDAGLRSALRAEWGVGDGETLIGIVARADPKKNHPLFIRAAGIAAPRDGLRWVIAGAEKAAFGAQLAALAEECGVASRIIWAGRRSDVAAVYNALDILTLCSNEAEGFPNVVAEAMACGTPCVVTASGAAPEIVADRGVVVERTAEAIASGWITAAKFNMPRAQVRERIVSEFSASSLGRRTDAVITGHFPELFARKRAE